MNIGFDLDKVLINYPPFVPEKLIDRIYKEQDNGKLVYRIPHRPEQLLRIFSHHPVFRKPLDKNIAFLQKLATKNSNKRFLISSRFNFLKKRTDSIMEKYNLKKLFHETYFNYDNKQPHVFKDEVLKKLKLDRYVDDDLSLLKYLHLRHPKTKFYWLNDNEQKKIAKNLFAITDITKMLT